MVEAITRARQEGIRDIQFSWGWFQKFLKRNNLTLRKPTTKSLKPKESEQKIEEFINIFQEKVASNIYDRNNIINVDETGFSTEH